MPNVDNEIKAILSKLDDDSLFALSRTVTQGLKKSERVEDAVQNIIKYSPSVISILRRKALTREILFDYLEGNNQKVRLPITKNELIDAIANYWNISMLGTENEDKLIIQKDNAESQEVKTQVKECNVNVMAEQFAKWFYSMLNSNDFGAEHFFPDARLKLNMFVGDECDTTELENCPDEITNALLNTRLKHNLYFHVNDSEDGIQGRMDPHGLVMILTCGTLHIQSVCAGVFEQVFSLARDPFSENNWKIRKTELNLRSQNNVAQKPKLTDSHLTNDLLMLPSE